MSTSTPGSQPEAAQDSQPEAAQDSQPEAAPDIQPEAAPDIQPHLQPTVEQLGDAARLATEAWDLDVTELSLLSLSENAVFRVDTADGARQVLRLHRPGYNTRQEMDAELAWVEALRAAGLDAPAPRRASNGQGYIEVPVSVGQSGAGLGEETRLAGVLEWVDGANLDELLNLSIFNPQHDPNTDVDEVARQYARIGGLLARIRQHGQTWDQPPGFTRRRWDADGLVGPDPLWGRFWEVPADPETGDLFRSARKELHRQLDQLETDRARFGLIHADLHSRNVMVHEDRMTIIDFDDAGFGWYIHDVAMALHPLYGEPWFPEVRDSLVEGYRRIHPLPESELSLLMAFLTIRSLMIVAWLNARPELGLQDHLPTVIARAADHASTFLGD